MSKLPFKLNQRPCGVSQKQVVKKSGMRQAFISLIENEHTIPTLADYEKYLNAIGKTLTVKKIYKTGE